MNIRNISRTLVLIMSATVLAACGIAGDLKVPEGNSLPPIPYGSEKRPTTDDMITPSVQTRPGRSDELLSRSVRRKVDPFDLPPGSEIADASENGEDSTAQSTPAQPE